MRSTKIYILHSVINTIRELYGLRDTCICDVINYNDIFVE